jgi:hypothetical protein
VNEPEEQQGAGFEIGQRQAREDEIVRAEGANPQVGRAEFREAAKPDEFMSAVNPGEFKEDAKAGEAIIGSAYKLGRKRRWRIRSWFGLSDKKSVIIRTEAVEDQYLTQHQEDEQRPATEEEIREAEREDTEVETIERQRAATQEEIKEVEKRKDEK